MKKIYSSLIGMVIAFSLMIYSTGVTQAQVATTEKLITVDRATQTLHAWEGGKIIRSISVSTGLLQTPTVTGTFRIYRKIPSEHMRGYSRVNGWYDLPNVPYTMYFYRGYAIHGAYWHNNFGRPMSNGCVNLPVDQAAWIYEWAPEGTQVVVY